MKAKCLLLLGLLACSTETVDTATETSELTLPSHCDAKFPPLYVWDGKPPPQLASGTWVVISTPYAGWKLFSLVDKIKATIPYAVYVHESAQASFSVHMIARALVGPGGNPPPPPCDTGPNLRCGQWMVTYARRVDIAIDQALEDCETCNLK